MDDPPQVPETPNPSSAQPEASQPETVVEALKASQLKDVLTHYGEALRARRKGIDKLNVYPVPDGDTGTNMSLTVASVVNELKGAASDDMRSISAAISKGAIMGARGNSGAILAQALRGVAESVKEKTALTPSDVADAFERARKGSYESVLKPVEGTILTVLSAAAIAARKSADEGHKLKDQMDHIRAASADALARTPELLPVLKQAGVVDAGGSGFLLFVDAMRYVATGEPIPGITDIEAGEDDSTPTANVASTEHSELSELRYEVMFLLENDLTNINDFREAWGVVGDSIVVVGGDGLWNCHIHTDDIGQAIEIALPFGKPSNIRVTDLMEQAGAVHGDAWSELNELDAAAAAAEAVTNQERVAVAVVGVVNGEGMADLYRDSGVQQLVVGGQSMNPSVAELLAAVEACPSDNVVLLPNNKNIHAAANQVDGLSDKHVVVLPTTSSVQGLATLVSYDASGDLDGVVAAMGEVSAHIVCGEVTQAVRSTTGPTGPIEEGDWLGIGPEGISVVEKSLVSAIQKLLPELIRDDSELLTVIEGEEATPETTQAIRTWVKDNHPEVEVDVHRGGQPLYPYSLGVE